MNQNDYALPTIVTTHPQNVVGNPPIGGGSAVAVPVAPDTIFHRLDEGNPVVEPVAQLYVRQYTQRNVPDHLRKFESACDQRFNLPSLDYTTIRVSTVDYNVFVLVIWLCCLLCSLLFVDIISHTTFDFAGFAGYSQLSNTRSSVVLYRPTEFRTTVYSVNECGAIFVVFILNLLLLYRLHVCDLSKYLFGHVRSVSTLVAIGRTNCPAEDLRVFHKRYADLDSADGTILTFSYSRDVQAPYPYWFVPFWHSRHLTSRIEVSCPLVGQLNDVYPVVKRLKDHEIHDYLYEKAVHMNNLNIDQRKLMEIIEGTIIYVMVHYNIVQESKKTIVEKRFPYRHDAYLDERNFH